MLTSPIIVVPESIPVDGVVSYEVPSGVRVIFKYFIGDVDDPQIYAGPYLNSWEKSEQGQWVKKNAIDTPSWNVANDIATYGYVVSIGAILTPENYTYWKLKFG